MSDTIYPDGWYLVTGNGLVKEVWWVENGDVIPGISVDEFIRDGFIFTPVVVLTKEEYDNLCAMYVEIGTEGY